MPKINEGLRFLSSEVRGLHAAVYVLAVCAMLSSLLALLRDRLLAHEFGAGIELDIYYAAFIPDTRPHFRVPRCARVRLHAHSGAFAPR